MIRVTCAVVFHENKILVTQRGPGMKQPFKWEFPGGKMEPGESEENCILRELEEELQISVTLTGRLKACTHNYGDFQILLIPFTAVYDSGNITLFEHMNFAWLSPDELPKLDWAPADVEVMEAVLEYLKNSQRSATHDS
jgi:8-oxo-dGTP diphosphatase